MTKEKIQVELKDIRTYSDLEVYFRTFLKEEEIGIDKNGRYDDAIYWFVAMQEAESLAENYSKKDIAHLFLNGIPAINHNPEAVTDWLEICFENVYYARQEGEDEEADELEKEVTDDLREKICSHFNITRSLP